MGWACKICSKLFSGDSEHILVVPCGHIFHGDCLNQWLTINRSSTCPQCSAKISVSEATKIFPTVDQSVSSESEQVLKEREKLEAEVVQKEIELHSLREEADRLRKLQTSLLTKSILEVSDVNYSILELEKKLLDVHLHLVELFYPNTDIQPLESKKVILSTEIHLYEVLQNTLSDSNTEEEIQRDTIHVDSLNSELSSTHELKSFVVLSSNVLNDIKSDDVYVASLKALHEHITKRNKSLKRSYFKIARFCEFFS